MVANNPSVKVISVENITEKDLILNFNTTMPGELGVDVLRDGFLSVHGDPVIGEACSLSSDGSEEDFHDSRKRSASLFLTFVHTISRISFAFVSVVFVISLSPFHASCVL